MQWHTHDLYSDVRTRESQEKDSDIFWRLMRHMLLKEPHRWLHPQGRLFLRKLCTCLLYNHIGCSVSVLWPVDLWNKCQILGACSSNICVYRRCKYPRERWAVRAAWESTLGREVRKSTSENEPIIGPITVLCSLWTLLSWVWSQVDNMSGWWFQGHEIDHWYVLRTDVRPEQTYYKSKCLIYLMLWKYTA